MITRQKVGGEMLFCVSERGQDVLGTFPTLAQAATVQRFMMGANMSNDAMAFAVHCMRESDNRMQTDSALSWADEMIMQTAAENRTVKRRKKKKKPAAAAQAGSGPAERGTDGKIPAAN